MDLDQLYSLLGSEARARILACFAAHPDARRSIADLQRLTGISIHALRAEMDELVARGLIHGEDDGRRTVYEQTWIPEWRSIECTLATHGIPLLLRSALAEVPGVEAAFIFGSLARGDARADSDIDLLIYGNGIPPGALSEGLGYVYGVLDRKLDDKLLDRELFQELSTRRGGFLPNALAGRKVWLIGSERELMRAAA